MSFRELFRTALHSLRINPIRSVLAILGVVFGVGAVVVLISMGQGVKTQITDQVRGLGTDLLIVKSGKEEKAADKDLNPSTSTAALGTSSLTDGDAKAVSGIKNDISNATATIEQAGQAEAPDSNKDPLGIKIIGGDKSFQAVRELKAAAPSKSWNFNELQPGECAVGQTVKSKLFGDNASDSELIGKKIKIQGKDFVIKAVAVKRDKSLFQDPNREVYIPLNDAREIFGAKDTNKVLEIYAKAGDASRVKEAKAAVDKAVAAEHEKIAREQGTAYDKNFFVATQDDLVSSYNKIFSILTALVLGVALVALTESGIGVSNIMYIAVKERTREIGVRLAQGASSRAILTQFLFESVTLCLVGSAIGIPLGWFVAFLINKYTVLPAQTPIWGVLVAFAAGTLVGVIAGVYPAWQATKSDIAVVLRSE